MEAVDLSPPVIGKRYTVPAVYGRWYRYSLRWWPVIGPKHDDVEYLDFDAQHYHLDLRFLYSDVFKHNVLSDMFAMPVNAAPEYDWNANLHAQPRVFVCKRESPRFPQLKDNLRFSRLYRAFRGKRLANGICPHKGANLSGQPAHENGCVVCPLHGLTFRDGVCVGGVRDGFPASPTGETN